MKTFLYRRSKQADKIIVTAGLFAGALPLVKTLQHKNKQVKEIYFSDKEELWKLYVSRCPPWPWIGNSYHLCYTTK